MGIVCAPIRHAVPYKECLHVASHGLAGAVPHWPCHRAAAVWQTGKLTKRTHNGFALLPFEFSPACTQLAVHAAGRLGIG
jgi:hypothetical protein